VAATRRRCPRAVVAGTPWVTGVRILLDSSRGRCTLTLVPLASSSVIGRHRRGWGGTFHVSPFRPFARQSRSPEPSPEFHQHPEAANQDREDAEQCREGHDNCNRGSHGTSHVTPAGAVEEQSGLGLEKSKPVAGGWCYRFAHVVRVRLPRCVLGCHYQTVVA
jgi:hypothetical protein